MIIVKLQGGLGNQMFQYALGRYLAYKNSTELKFDVDSYKTNPLGDYSFSLEQFNINIRDHLATPHEIEQFKKYQRKTGMFGFLHNQLFADETKYAQEKSMNFDSTVLEIKDPAYIHGWWQSELYFTAIRSILLKDFTLRTSLKGKNKEIADYAKIKPSVSIHIRRCDYITNLRTCAYHGELTKEYYSAGLSYITKSIPCPTLFVFSDDIEWVKRNISFPLKTIYIEGNMAKPHEDMYLMSLCKHHIIANSSFSWWGAWLSQNPNKIVVAPKKWTNDIRDINERVPEKWIKI